MSNVSRYLAGVAFAGALALTPSILKDAEGIEYKVYMDIAGIPTVCNGITGSDVVLGKTYTQAECDRLLFKHIAVASKGVDSAVRFKIPDTMRAAMYSFTYNTGVGAFRNSTMLKLINQGKLREACNELHKWNKYRDPKTKKMKVARGLTNRRAVEYGYCVKDLK